MDLNSQGTNMHQTAYMKLCELIADGDLKPGEPLNERQLMEQLQVGRTPLREAIQQLAMEETLLVVPRSGTYVRPMGEEEITALYEARLCIEPEVARIATGKVDKAMLDKCSVLFTQTDDPRAMMENDFRFHYLLAQATRNIHFVRMVKVFFFHTRRIRGWEFDSLEKRIDTYQSHLEIIDPLLAGDELAAKDAMYRHILCAQERSLASLRKREGRD